MAPEPDHSETMSGAPSSSEPMDVGANAALILAALGRIEAVVRDQRGALASLRASLGEMAQAIARAKAVADSENAATMLDEFEHRVDAMIEIAGGRLAAEQATESDQVPTVSDVVLRLGPGDVAPEPAIAAASPPAESTGDKGPTVAMLTAMVEALSASIQAPTPEPEPEVAPPAAHRSEPTPPAPAMAADFGAGPAAAEAAAMTEPEPAPETPAEAALASLPGETLARESTLLASFEQMESRPFPPPEEGTAVIFTSPADPVPESPAEHGFAETQFEPAAAPEPSLAADIPSPPDVVSVEPEAASPSDAPAQAKSVDAYFDPADFLFGPEPEPDPAAFLLDTAPPPRTPKAILPQPEFVAPPSEPPPSGEPQPEPEPEPEREPQSPEAEAPQAALPAEIDPPAETTPTPHDPLRALKAMSANEKLAIFS